MAGVTVTARLSADSADLMRKCVEVTDQDDVDAFFEAAIGALAAELLRLNRVLDTGKRIAERCDKRSSS